ncbi:MAG: T9SS type A sorting domain-containing protein [Sphingobacteriales bacterium]|nr:MAG: T9SS type A sorting domain-containing protein [Sphingobacteriales bacterium]
MSKTYSIYLTLLLLSSTHIQAFAKDNKLIEREKASLSLIENKGQVTDQYRVPRADIDFKLGTAGMNIFIGDAAIHYQWVKNKPRQLPVQATAECEMYRMDVILMGANKHAQIIREEPHAYYENYHTSAYKGTAASFNKIIYKNVYPLIDWVLYTDNEQLKYDFIVHPGGNPKDIKLQYKGATSMGMEDGAALAATPLGIIKEHKPYSYDAVTKQEVPSSFHLEGNTLAFNISGNSEHDIVIDPVLQWATYYNGMTGTIVLDVAVNKTDDAYICGFTPNTTNIATTGAHQTTYGGGSLDAFVAKFNTTGSRLWATYYGGTGMDHFATVAVDTSGDILLCGETYSTSGVTTSGAHKTTYSDDGDVMLVKMNSSGGVMWGTYFGGTGRETGRIALDQSNNVYLSGLTKSTTGIATSGAYKASISGSSDAYIARFSPSGSLLWASYFGGTGDDESQTIDCDNAGNTYIAGGTYGDATGLATSGAHQPAQGAALANFTDGFLCKWSNTGSLLWSTYYGGRNFDQVYGVACDASGSNVYMVGTSRSANNIATAGSHQTTVDTAQNHAFLAKFNSSGVRQWGTYFAGNLDEEPRSIDVAANGNILFSSFTYSSSGIATPGSHKTSRTGSSDYFIAEFTPAGFRNWASYFGGDSYEYLTAGTGSSRIGGGALTTSASGKVYFVGGTYSNTGVATPGAFLTTTGADGSINLYDGFLSSWVTDTSITIDQPFIDTLLCTGHTFDIRYSTTVPFNAGNSFTAQLSDATGSFSSPINIGSKADIDSGKITVTIPATTLTGSGYRIRIVSTNPARVSDDNGINIHIKPTPAVVATSNSPLCSGDTLKLWANSPVPGPISYYWAGPASFSSPLQNPIITPAAIINSGSYIVVASLNGCYAADTVTVLVNIKPDTPFVSSNSPVCIGDTLYLTANSSTAGVVYEWNGPMGFFSLQPNPYIANMQTVRTGTYTVKAVLNNCASATASVNVSVITCFPEEVNDVVAGKALKLFPNPNKGSFIVSNIHRKEARIEIINSLGQSVYSDHITNIAGSVKIDTNLPSGVYFIRITGNGKEGLSTSFTIDK